jgi:hypothetical protein
MRASFGSSIVSRLAGAVAGLWLCGAGAAWAGGGGGADLTTIQALLSDPNTGLCKLFNMSSCPQLPTATQAILQVAGLGNNLPEMVGAQNSIPLGSRVTAGNPAAVPPSPGSLTPLPLTSTTTPTVSEFLATLTPLAFISQNSGTAIATQLYDPKADAFLYAVGVTSFGTIGPGNLTAPDTAYFFYDDLSRTNQNLKTGQVVAKLSFPLTILNSDGSERAIPTILNFTATNAGDCSASTVTGNFSGAPSGTQTLMASKIGINCAVVFSKSPTSMSSHAIFEVAVPLLITGACQSPHAFCLTFLGNLPFMGQSLPGPNTDPAYFYSLHNPPKTNPVNTGVFTAFTLDDLGATLTSLGALPPIGLAPTAAPFGPPPPAGGTSSFALCANLPGGNGNGQAPVPSVGAYYSVATSGEMFLSAPLPAASSSVCPPM